MLISSIIISQEDPATGVRPSGQFAAAHPTVSSPLGIECAAGKAAIIHGASEESGGETRRNQDAGDE